MQQTLGEVAFFACEIEDWLKISGMGTTLSICGSMQPLKSQNKMKITPHGLVERYGLPIIGVQLKTHYN